MAKMKRLRVKVIQILQEHEIATSSEIYDMLNEHKGRFSIGYGGCKMPTLNNLLGKERVFLKMVDHTSKNAPRIEGLNGTDYKVCAWALNKTLLNEVPELLDKTFNSFSGHRPKSSNEQ